MLILKSKRRKQKAEFRRKEKGPSVEQKFLGGGNVVIRKANRSEKFADIVADLGVALDSPTPSESRRDRINKRSNWIEEEKMESEREGKPCSCSCAGGGLRSTCAERESGGVMKKVRWRENAVATRKRGAGGEIADPYTSHLHFRFFFFFYEYLLSFFSLTMPHLIEKHRQWMKMIWKSFVFK